jgi:hypothetical protein
MIVKVKHSGDFAIISNAALKDERLSFKAKGILCYLMGKPKNWEIRLADLEKQGKDGRESVANGIKELKEAGYACTIQVRDGGRIVDNQTFVSDDPKALFFEKRGAVPVSKLKTEIRETRKPGKPEPGKTGTRETRSLNNIDSNKKEENKIEAGESKMDSPSNKGKTTFDNSNVGSYDAFLEALQPWIIKNYPQLLDLSNNKIREYFEEIRDWSRSGRKLKLDWVATTRNWIRRDYKSGSKPKRQSLSYK